MSKDLSKKKDARFGTDMSELVLSQRRNLILSPPSRARGIEDLIGIVSRSSGYQSTGLALTEALEL